MGPHLVVFADIRQQQVRGALVGYDGPEEATPDAARRVFAAEQHRYAFSSAYIRPMTAQETVRYAAAGYQPADCVIAVAPLAGRPSDADIDAFCQAMTRSRFQSLRYGRYTPVRPDIERNGETDETHIVVGCECGGGSGCRGGLSFKMHRATIASAIVRDWVAQGRPEITREHVLGFRRIAGLPEAAGVR